MKKRSTYRITGVSNLTDIRVVIIPSPSLPVAIAACHYFARIQRHTEVCAYREIRIEPTQPEDLPLIFLPYDHKQ